MLWCAVRWIFWHRVIFHDVTKFLCEMNFNLKVFTQREEAKNCSRLYLIWKVRGKIILHHYRSISQIQLSFHFTFGSAKQTYLIFILLFWRNGNICVRTEIKLIAYCKTKSKPFSLHTDTLHGLYCKSTYHSGENTDLIPCFSIRWQSGDWLGHSIT